MLGWKRGSESSERSSGRAAARRCSGAGGAGGRTAASRGGRRSRASPPPSARPTATGQRGLRPCRRRRGLASSCCRARRSAPCCRAAAPAGFARRGYSRPSLWLTGARFPPAAERSCPCLCPPLPDQRSMPLSDRCVERALSRLRAAALVVRAASVGGASACSVGLSCLSPGRCVATGSNNRSASGNGADAH